jgi:hypothetical protein
MSGRTGVLVEMLGRRYGRLVVIERVENDRHNNASWRCLCDCGQTVRVLGASLRRGNTRSCGCYSRDRARTPQHRITHGHAAYGKSPTYLTWRAMLSRCRNPKNPDFHVYGVLGVTRLWRDSFEVFLEDMGERPHGTSIDRIDNRFGYFLSNCRWATPKQQRANRRRAA